MLRQSSFSPLPCSKDSGDMALKCLEFQLAFDVFVHLLIHSFIDSLIQSQNDAEYHLCARTLA